MLSNHGKAFPCIKIEYPLLDSAERAFELFFEMGPFSISISSCCVNTMPTRSSIS
jgi:hypothetical protein